MKQESIIKHCTRTGLNKNRKAVHPLAKTGIGVLPLIGGIVILMGVGLVLTLGGRRRTNRGRHMA